MAGVYSGQTVAQTDELTSSSTASERHAVWAAGRGKTHARHILAGSHTSITRFVRSLGVPEDATVETRLLVAEPEECAAVFRLRVTAAEQELIDRDRAKDGVPSMNASVVAGMTDLEASRRGGAYEGGVKGVHCY